MRKPSISIKLLLFYILIAIVTAEIGLRIFWVKKLVLGAGINQPHFHHRLLPNTEYHYTSSEFDVHVMTNSYGLRGPNPEIPKPEDTLRLLVLGDSYTFGFPVEDAETFVALTEQGLQAEGLPIEVINGGVSGYSPTLHYISLRDQFMQFEPDAVVLWLDIGDMMEDHAFQKNLIFDEEGKILRADPRYIFGEYDLWGLVQRHSALARYLNNKLVRTYGKIEILGLGGYIKTKLRGERSKVAIARLKREQRTADLAIADKFLFVRPDSTRELLEPYWELTAGYITKIRDLLAEEDIPLIVGIYPYGMLVGPEEWGDGRVYWGFEKGKTYDASALIEIVEDFCRRENIPLINTYDSFREATGGKPLFYNWDGHFTPRGQRLMAEQFLANPKLRHVLMQKLQGADLLPAVEATASTE